MRRRHIGALDVGDGDDDGGILSKTLSKYLHELTDVDVGRGRLVVVGPLDFVGLLDVGRFVVVVVVKLRVVVVIWVVVELRVVVGRRVVVGLLAVVGSIVVVLGGVGELLDVVVVVDVDVVDLVLPINDCSVVPESPAVFIEIPPGNPVWGNSLFP